MFAINLLSLGTALIPLSPHPAVLGIFMFLNGISTGALENGNVFVFRSLSEHVFH